MDASYLAAVLDIESAALNLAVRNHPRLQSFFTLDCAGQDQISLRESYLRFLKMKADYVFHTIPMLRAAGDALKAGDEEDRQWSERFLEYANGETDEEEGYGHHVWALEDMRALGASKSQLDAPPHPSVQAYARYFVDEAQSHPYAILGTKGVLEHLSIRMSDDLVAGVLATGFANAPNAVSFFKHHGILDIDHVQSGDKNLERLKDSTKRFQVLQGAYFTTGCYRAFLSFYL